MEKQVITKEQAIEGLRNLFDISDSSIKKAYESDGEFGVNKQFLERFEVIAKLQDYFKDKMFVAGLGLEVGNITFVYTAFEIKEIKSQ